MRVGVERLPDRVGPGEVEEHGVLAVVQEMGGYDDRVAVDVTGGDQLPEVGLGEHALPLLAGRLVPGMDQHGQLVRVIMRWVARVYTT